MRMFRLLKMLLSVASARIRQLADTWSTSTTDVIVICLMLWCACVLHYNPDYLASTPRLTELGPEYQGVWEFLFAVGVVYQLTCLIFGSEDQPLGVVNPLMRTERQAMAWKLLRMAGWLFSMFVNFLIVLLISKQGWLNFGTGFFAFAGILSTIAFSVPFRMFCADIRTRIDRRNQKLRQEQIRRAIGGASSRIAR